MKKIIAVPTIFLSVFSSAASSSQNASQFDLDCIGNMENGHGYRKTTGPFRQLIHLDLAAKKYCVDSCETVDEIYDVNPVKISIKYFHAISFSRRTVDYMFIDRRNGHLTIHKEETSRNEIFIANAVCTALPFTPFPKTLF